MGGGPGGPAMPSASAMAEGSPFTIVDMFAAYSSPIDWAFAYCDDVT